MIKNNLALNELLNNMVIARMTMTNEIYNEIMEFVLYKDTQQADQIAKWVKNCDTLMGKLSETK